MSTHGRFLFWNQTFFFFFSIPYIIQVIDCAGCRQNSRNVVRWGFYPSTLALQTRLRKFSVQFSESDCGVGGTHGLCGLKVSVGMLARSEPCTISRPVRFQNESVFKASGIATLTLNMRLWNLGLFWLFFCDFVCGVMYNGTYQLNNNWGKKKEREREKYVWPKELLETTPFDKIIYWK